MHTHVANCKSNQATTMIRQWLFTSLSFHLVQTRAVLLILFPVTVFFKFVLRANKAC